MTRLSLRVGLYAEDVPNPGWRRILEQERMPYAVTDSPEFPVIVFSGCLPKWFEGFVQAGGAAVVSDCPNASFLPSSSTALIHRWTPPGRAYECYAPSLARLFRAPGQGHCRIHENRVVRNGNETGVNPVVHCLKIGRGAVILSGFPLTSLLTAAGDSLRCFSSHSEVSERVTSVDKAEVADSLVWMLAAAFEHVGLPYVTPCRFPEGAPSVLMLRVDVDGAYGERAMNIAKVAADHEISASFFINGAMCEAHPGGLNFDGCHEIGQHGYEHDVFDDYEKNIDNLRQGEAWFARRFGAPPSSFVAPRGLFNRALDRALMSAGYRYSSDFSVDFDSLPFRTEHGLLQIPVHPYSPERASRFAQENGLPPPSAETVARHYLSTIDRQMEMKRPAYLYGHPEVLGQMAHEVLPQVFSFARKRALPSMSLGGFADWWEARARVTLSCEVSDDRRCVTVFTSDGDRWPMEVRAAGPVDVRHAGQTSRLGSGVWTLNRDHSRPSAATSLQSAIAPETRGQALEGIECGD